MTRFLATLVGLILLLVIVAFVAGSFIPANTYETKIVQVVKAQTGRDLTIGGDIKFSLFPSIGVKAEDVRLSNASWAKDPDMATMKELRVALKILPLLRGEVQIDSFALIDPVIHLEVKADGTPNWRFDTGLSAKASMSAENTGARSGNSISVNQVRFGDVSIENGTASYVNAQTHATADGDRVNINLIMPSLDEPFKVGGSLVWNGDQVSILLQADRPRTFTDGGDTALVLDIKSAKLNTSYKGTLHIIGGLSLAGDVDLDVPSVRDLAAWLGNPLPKGNGFGKLAITGKASAQDSTYNFTQAKISFDGMNATGELAADLGGSKPKFTGRLSVDRIDTNTYLSNADISNAARSAGEGAPATISGGGNQGWSNAPIDLSSLRAVDADFSLAAHEILFNKIKIGESALTLSLNNGVLNADLTRILLYNGVGTGTLTLKGTGVTPQVVASLSISGVSAEPLLTDAASFRRLRGSTALNFAISTSGGSQRQMVSALDGDGAVKFTNGAIKGINIASLMRNVLSAAVTGWDGGGSEDTDFSILSGTFTIAKGILNNKDLQMLSPFIRITGAGTVDLPNKVLNYRVEPKLAATLLGQSIEVPVIIEGPGASPRFRPDLTNMLKNPTAIVDAVKGLKSGGVKSLLQSLAGGTSSADSSGNTKKTSPRDALKSLFGN